MTLDKFTWQVNHLFEFVDVPRLVQLVASQVHGATPDVRASTWNTLQSAIVHRFSGRLPMGAVYQRILKLRDRVLSEDSFSSREVSRAIDIILTWPYAQKQDNIAIKSSKPAQPRNIVADAFMEEYSKRRYRTDRSVTVLPHGYSPTRIDDTLWITWFHAVDLFPDEKVWEDASKWPVYSQKFARYLLGMSYEDKKQVLTSFVVPVWGKAKKNLTLYSLMARLIGAKQKQEIRNVSEENMNEFICDVYKISPSEALLFWSPMQEVEPASENLVDTVPEDSSVTLKKPAEITPEDVVRYLWHVKCCRSYLDMVDHWKQRKNMDDFVDEYGESRILGDHGGAIPASVREILQLCAWHFHHKYDEMMQYFFEPAYLERIQVNEARTVTDENPVATDFVPPATNVASHVADTSGAVGGVLDWGTNPWNAHNGNWSEQSTAVRMPSFLNNRRAPTPLPPKPTSRPTFPSSPPQPTPDPVPPAVRDFTTLFGMAPLSVSSAGVAVRTAPPVSVPVVREFPPENVGKLEAILQNEAYHPGIRFVARAIAGGLTEDRLPDFITAQVPEGRKIVPLLKDLKLRTKWSMPDIVLEIARRLPTRAHEPFMTELPADFGALDRSIALRVLRRNVFVQEVLGILWKDGWLAKVVHDDRAIQWLLRGQWVIFDALRCVANFGWQGRLFDIIREIMNPELIDSLADNETYRQLMEQYLRDCETMGEQAAWEKLFRENRGLAERIVGICDTLNESNITTVIATILGWEVPKNIYKSDSSEWSTWDSHESLSEQQNPLDALRSCYDLLRDISWRNKHTERLKPLRELLKWRQIMWLKKGDAEEKDHHLLAVFADILVQAEACDDLDFQVLTSCSERDLKAADIILIAERICAYLSPKKR